MVEKFLETCWRSFFRFIAVCDIFAQNADLKATGAILFFLLLLAGVSANAQTATLEIIADEDAAAPFYVFMNGVKQNEAPAAQIVITNIPYEVYGVEIQTSDHRSSIKELVFLRRGKIKNYRLVKSQGSLQLLEGIISDLESQAGTVTRIEFKTGQPAIEPSERYRNEDFAVRAAPVVNFDDESEPALQQKQPVFYQPDPDTAVIAAEIPAPPARDCLSEITQEDVKLLRTKMRNIVANKEKLLTAINSLSKACLTVQQLKDIMRLLEGDEAKIALYIQVSRNILDPRNRSDLYDLFYFENSIDEIRSCK